VARLFRLIPIMVCLLAALDAPLRAIEGTCAEVACCDGSMHPCGFDCESYCMGRQGGGGGSYGGGNPVMAGVQAGIQAGVANLVSGMFSSGNSGPSPEEIAEQQRRQAAVDMNNQAMALYNQGSWQAAVDGFTAASAKDPDNATIRQNLADASSRLAFENGKAEALGEMKDRDSAPDDKQAGPADDPDELKPAGGKPHPPVPTNTPQADKGDPQWCKLHRPLRPVASFVDAGELDDMRWARYVARMEQWCARCQPANEDCVPDPEMDKQDRRIPMDAIRAPENGGGGPPAH
jgi:hypothetical protein